MVKDGLGVPVTDVAVGGRGLAASGSPSVSCQGWHNLVVRGGADVLAVVIPGSSSTWMVPGPTGVAADQHCADGGSLAAGICRLVGENVDDEARPTPSPRRKTGRASVPKSGATESESVWVLDNPSKNSDN